MKKFLLTLLFLFFCISSAYCWVDTLGFLSEKQEYSEIVSSVWNAKDLSLVLSNYENFVSKLNLQNNKDLVFYYRSTLIVARYCTQENNKKEAKKLVEKAKDCFEKIKDIKEYESVRDALESEMDSVLYLISPLGNLSKGLSSSKLIEKAYENYPSEVSVSLAYANRLFYAPAIGGRDIKTAYEIYCNLLDFKEINKWDKFSVLSGMGMYFKEKKDTDKALSYLTQASDIYYGDPEIIKAIGQIKKEK